VGRSLGALGATVNLAKVCERYGGGGHARVGAISFGVTEEEAARKPAVKLPNELRAKRAPAPSKIPSSRAESTGASRSGFRSRGTPTHFHYDQQRGNHRRNPVSAATKPEHSSRRMLAWVTRFWFTTPTLNAKRRVLAITGPGLPVRLRFAVLNRLDEPTSGTVLSRVRTIAIFPARAGRKLGHGDATPYCFLGSVADNLRFGPPSAAETCRPKPIAELLVPGWLKDYGGRDVAHLSGAEAQRVFRARTWRIRRLPFCSTNHVGFG